MRLCIAYAGDLSYPSGGTDRVTALASGLQNRGHDVTLVTPSPGAELPPRLADVQTHTVSGASHGSSNRVLRALRITREAERVARERDALLQLEHSTLAGIGTLHLRRPFVLDMHDLAYARYDHVDSRVAPVMQPAVKLLEKRAVRKAAHVVAVSERMRELIDGWDTPGGVTVMPNGFFPERIEQVQDVETRPGRVAFLGTLHPKVSVETIAGIAELPEVTDFPVIGTGAQQDALERLAETTDALRVTGRLPDEEAFRLLASAEVAVNPQELSRLQQASSPVKLYYYAALGRPMVISPGPSVADELVAEDAAVVAESGQAFVESVRQVLSDAERANALSQNATRAARAFDWSRRINRIADTYERMRTTRAVE